MSQERGLQISCREHLVHVLNALCHGRFFHHTVAIFWGVCNMNHHSVNGARQWWSQHCSQSICHFAFYFLPRSLELQTTWWQVTSTEVEKSSLWVVWDSRDGFTILTSAGKRSSSIPVVSQWRVFRSPKRVILNISPTPFLSGAKLT